MKTSFTDFTYSIAKKWGFLHKLFRNFWLQLVIFISVENRCCMCWYIIINRIFTLLILCFSQQCYTLDVARLSNKKPYSTPMVQENWTTAIIRLIFSLWHIVLFFCKQKYTFSYNFFGYKQTGIYYSIFHIVSAFSNRVEIDCEHSETMLSSSSLIALPFLST